MTIIWSDRETQDPDRFDIVTSVTVDGTRVVVKITTEANEDKGRDKCKAKAEEKLRAAAAASKLPKEITVSNNDFGASR